MKKKISIVLLLLFFTQLWAVDINVNQIESENSQLKTTGKAYFGEEIFQGNFKENREFRYNPNYIINIGDVIYS